MVEFHATLSQTIEVRRFDLRVLPTDMPPTKVVRDDDQDVWFVCLVASGMLRRPKHADDARGKQEGGAFHGNASVIRDRLPQIPASRVIFKTRNSKIWAHGDVQFQENFVGLSLDAAQFLVDRNYKLVGIDYLSIAPFNDSSPTHIALLGAGIPILEGVNLSKVQGGRYTLFCLPLNILAADGAPTRAILVR